MELEGPIICCLVCRYGVVLKELSDKNGARKMLQRSLALTPMLWSAWSELAKLTEDRKMVSSILAFVIRELNTPTLSNPL